VFFCKFYGREHKPPITVDTDNQASTSIQGPPTLSCHGTSTPLGHSSDNSNISSVPLRRCRVRLVNIDDASASGHVDESSMC